MDLLQQEYVLVQAWKKTASYIRYHNWFSDTLELDRAAVNLPTFIAEIAERLQSPDQWKNDVLRIVLVPKSQRWRVSPTSGAWEPREKGAKAARLRPLAHVSLRDQVVATALMLCLANRVETRQGDPRGSVLDIASRKRVVSYGNRLFCDADGGELFHRWGSVKLYRAYYEDYRKFLSRPKVVAEAADSGQRVFIVHSDLRQFYDRVHPTRLANALRRIQRDHDDLDFFGFAARVLDWGWHTRDAAREVAIYVKQAGLEDFSRVALPQGLVAAGFFANIALLDFDSRLGGAIGEEIGEDIRLDDACRYVDDFRLVVTADQYGEDDLDRVKNAVVEWLQGLLEDEAPGLEFAGEKTKVVKFGGERPLVFQSMKMSRIQSAVSGGFDAIGGEEILDSIQGLMRSQQALSDQPEKSGWRFSPLPDVRDETVARFAAARFRTTFRSIRPLLEDSTPLATNAGESEAAGSTLTRPGRNQHELDEDVRAFALGLIERWVEDPSNVRLLRIGLDLWPDTELLRAVLGLLRPFTEKGGRRKAPRRVAWYSRRVAWYCLSEILRAGATETGLVEDDECLPTAVDLTAYRTILREEAARLVPLPHATIPWYLRQQALLFLATYDPTAAPVVRTGRSAETKHYREMIRFLRGEGGQLRIKGSEFATLAVLSRRAFSDREKSIALTLQALTPPRKREIAERDPSFVLELIETETDNFLFSFHDLPARVREDLCLEASTNGDDRRSLFEIVMQDRPTRSLRNELALLRFASSFLEKLPEAAKVIETITPMQMQLKLELKNGIANVEELTILAGRAAPTGSLYRPPDWCVETDRWRFHLGFLLRFILARRQDFTRTVRPPHWKETAAVYRAGESHWYQRLYGLFNGQLAFGDDWLPITDWVEKFLSALLRWPGCRIPEDFDWVEHGIQETLLRIRERISLLESKVGSSTKTLLLPMIAKWPTASKPTRPLRACIVQTAIPREEDFEKADLMLSEPAVRRQHRNHLSAALATVERMLVLRETHSGNKLRLDWLILPELAVHRQDVRTHLIPFARAHRTIVLAGLVYENLPFRQTLVNSALWIIPEWSKNHGLQMRTLRQGKLHLAPGELKFNEGSTRIKGFRPCQWLVGYPWSDDPLARPMWLTASVCYDATDLNMVADLRDESDVFAIPALNKDVKTFDQMALALHYHMFQLVIVANTGQYGGSNAYWPSNDVVKRQIFHLHGQPQATVAFLEIEDIAKFLKRCGPPGLGNDTPWKYPPAGLNGPAGGGNP